jgi:hypothetical protein
MFRDDGVVMKDWDSGGYSLCMWRLAGSADARPLEMCTKPRRGRFTEDVLYPGKFTKKDT